MLSFFLTGGRGQWRGSCSLARTLVASAPSARHTTEPTAADRLRNVPAEVFAGGMRQHHIANTAYPIGHLETIRSYRVPRTRDQTELHQALHRAYGHLDEAMLYAHVPFCQQRCQFCEYTVVDPRNGRKDDVQDQYFDALLEEMAMYQRLLGTERKLLRGFDIGGGTPSMASIRNIERLMNSAHRMFRFPSDGSMLVSIETTPKIAAAEPDKIKAYYDMGIRRISFGLQTTDFSMAKKLGRDDVDYVRAAVDNVRAAGFKSLNIDLMYGFPLRADRPDTFPQTVQNTMDLGPEHITLYRMRYKGTKMAHLASRVPLQQVNAQEAAARDLLESNGFRGWVGKNTYSREPGSSGCSDYLDRRVVQGIPYIGCGLGAQSFSHESLAYNLGAVTKKLSQYLLSVQHQRIPIQDMYMLPKSGAMGKFIAVSFYYGGIDLQYFRDIFGDELRDNFADEIDFVIQRKLMELVTYDGRPRLQLTKLGKAHFAGVVALFYAPAVQRYVMNLPGGEAIQTAAAPSILASLPPAALRAPTPLPDASGRPRGGAAAPATLLGMRPRASTALPMASTAAMSTLASPLPKSDAEGPFTFGNILFGGPCNQRCYFCIGKQLAPELSPNNQRQFPPANLDAFIARMRSSKTNKIIFTGTTTDPQLYKYESELIARLRAELVGCHISLHTNGLLATRKMAIFNLYDSATLSINSFVPKTYQAIHGVKNMPDLASIMQQSRIPVKLSCVITDENKDQVDDYLASAARLGVKRVAIRHQFQDSRRFGLFSTHTPVSVFCGNPVYRVHGIEVTYWVFDTTQGASLNLFADGSLSPHYLLAKCDKNTRATAPVTAASSTSAP